jgi:GT2 family glycosyltransferase
MAASRPRVFVVVLNWNQWDLTWRTLKSVSSSAYAPLDVVLVDNASDGNVDSARIESHGVSHFVRTDVNLGYAGGNNAGIEIAMKNQADYIWVLNNDAFLSPSTLSTLVSAIESDSALGAVTSNVRSDGDAYDPDVAFAGHSRNAPWDMFGDAAFVQCKGCERGLHLCDCVRGPSLLFRSAALRDVGLFDEEYFHYFEEMDLVERLRRAGWRLGLACQAVVSHRTGSTLTRRTGKSLYYLLRNYLLFRRKLYGETTSRVFLRRPYKLTRYVLAPAHTFKGETRVLRANLVALVDGIRSRTGPRDLPSWFDGKIE